MAQQQAFIGQPTGQPQQAGGYPGNIQQGYVQQQGYPAGAPMPVGPQAVAAGLMNAKGVAIRQETQKLEVAAQLVGVPYEAKNKYKVALLPEEVKVATAPNDPERWKPTGDQLLQLDQFLFAKEESGLCMRTFLMCCGIGNLRPLQMHFSVNPASGDAYLINRPFECGGACCCPLKMIVYGQSPEQGQPPRVIGRIREDFDGYCHKCCLASCCCIRFHDIEVAAPDGSTGPEGPFEKLYKLRVNTACCGRVNNFCGATCFKNDAVFDILDREGNIVAHLQKTFASSGVCGAICRSQFNFDNYLLSFPADSTAEQRMLLVASVFQLDYQLYEKTGEENDGGIDIGG